MTDEPQQEYGISLRTSPDTTKILATLEAKVIEIERMVTKNTVFAKVPAKRLQNELEKLLQHAVEKDPMAREITFQYEPNQKYTQLLQRMSALHDKYPNAVDDLGYYSIFGSWAGHIFLPQALARSKPARHLVDFLFEKANWIGIPDPSSVYGPSTAAIKPAAQPAAARTCF